MFRQGKLKTEITEDSVRKYLFSFVNVCSRLKLCMTPLIMGTIYNSMFFNDDSA